ncbi:MAG TPA: DUF1549 and DUF1553 domain-containing protein [Gemmataceae bacterium]|nr:DUF1549 and DUF1553 domain-containing protein [Gemmataceae bacterium]
MCFRWFCWIALFVAAPALADDLPANWAFRPMGKPTPPAVRDRATVRNPIDAFIVAELEKHHLTPSPPADRRTLIRRVYFDLIGLPPNPEEIDAFVNDPAPNAYEKLVERLLESPRFGERQAVFWLDLVRFAESDGFKADDPRPNAWRYRDYVIRSFNADKPYNRFVQEQLAGDELFPSSAEALIATGYLRHFPDEYNAVNCEQRRQEILNDITDTTASTFLGLTVGCAKCHDHKYDPILQSDYYRLQAHFAAFWPVDEPILNREERQHYEERLQQWEAKTTELRQKIDALEKPYREKAEKKERQRFVSEYSSIVDIPMEKRTPLQKQLGAMVEKQVFGRSTKDVGKVMKGAVKEQWDGMMKRMTELEKEKPPEPPLAMACTDVGHEAPPTHLLKRGDWRKPDEEVQPGFPKSVAMEWPNERSDKPNTTHSTGRRARLAAWITAPENPLTARVIVNRIWQAHFGRGVVGTPSDFGVQGDRPTHPELLDWLARELVRNNWSLKAIHRLIVLSATYRQNAECGMRNAELNAQTIPHSAFHIPHSIDPDNRLLWHFSRRRLDAEALRDSLLAVSGQLNPAEGGASIYPELPEEMKKSAKNWPVSATAAERNRRSVYIAVRRNLRYPMLAMFDAPDNNETCARRYVTTTAPQALMLLNDKIVVDIASQFASRIQREAGDDAVKLIDRAFELALARKPDAEEASAMRRFVEDQKEMHRVAGAKNPLHEAVTDLCHSVLNLNEFLFVD